MLKTVKDFYLEKKKESLLNINIPLKTKRNEPQETLNKYIKYFPRIRKLKEAEYFREEWIEPEIIEIESQA